jgi:hypothetical protein
MHEQIEGFGEGPGSAVGPGASEFDYEAAHGTSEFGLVVVDTRRMSAKYIMYMKQLYALSAATVTNAS